MNDCYKKLKTLFDGKDKIGFLEIGKLFCHFVKTSNYSFRCLAQDQCPPPLYKANSFLLHSFGYYCATSTFVWE